MANVNELVSLLATMSNGQGTSDLNGVVNAINAHRKQNPVYMPFKPGTPTLQQKALDWQKVQQEAELTGMYNGSPTLDALYKMGSLAARGSGGYGGYRRYGGGGGSAGNTISNLNAYAKGGMNYYDYLSNPHQESKVDNHGGRLVLPGMDKDSAFKETIKTMYSNMDNVGLSGSNLNYAIKDVIGYVYGADIADDLETEDDDW